MSRVFNIPNGILCVLVLVCLVPAVVIALSFDSLSKRMSKLEEVLSQPPVEYYSIKLPTPTKGEVSNPYYEGFFRDYGDGDFHPHRQALMLLLTHLAGQSERPATTNETPDQKFKENK